MGFGQAHDPGLSAALSSQKAVMPEDAINERETRLHGNDDSLDDVDDLVQGQNGHNANDIEAGVVSQKASACFARIAPQCYALTLR